MWMLVVFIFSVVATLCHGQCEIHEKVCECDPLAEVCEFKLVIEELQTFTSYKVPKNPAQVIPHLGGATYYLSHGKYIRSRSLEEEDQGCLLEEASSEEDFTNNGCTVPATVDGDTFRAFIGVNGLSPGPTLIAHENQIISVNVSNQLQTEVTSMHWHGIHQKQTPWMDGGGLVSQAPIQPGSTFRYIFLASPPGSHWYHSHMGAQRTDGLAGALIVREGEAKENRSRALLGELMPGLETFRDEPGKHTLILMDWQPKPSIGLFARFQSALGFYLRKAAEKIPTDSESFYEATKSPDGAEVGTIPFWSGMINGKGRHTAYTDEPVAYEDSQLSVFEVEEGNLYRFRVIGVQSLYAYRFSIDDHKLILVATDGDMVEPIIADYVIVHSGERYDFILNTTGNNITNYWIRAETVESEANDFLDHMAEAILHYTGADVPSPASNYSEVTSERRTCSPDDKCVAANCPFKEFPASFGIDCIHIHQFRSLEDEEGKELPTLEVDEGCTDCVHFLNFGFDGRGRTSSINARNFILPPTPYMSYPEQYELDLNSKKTCQLCGPEDEETGEPSPECACTHVRVLASHLENTNPYRSHDPTIQLIISSIGDRGIGSFKDFSHPVHLHGHYFHVLHVEHGLTVDGVLNKSTEDIVCNHTRCFDPRWGVEKNLSEYRGDPVPGQTNTYYIRSKTVRKDTVLVPAGGYVIVYFRADNPGYWLMHCHIELHQLGGMALIFREYGSHPPPPPDINKCGDFSWTVEDFKRSLGFTGQSSTDSYISLHVAWIAILSFLSLMFVILATAASVVFLYTYKHRKGYKRV